MQIYANICINKCFKVQKFLLQLCISSYSHIYSALLPKISSKSCTLCSIKSTSSNMVTTCSCDCSYTMHSPDVYDPLTVISGSLQASIQLSFQSAFQPSNQTVPLGSNLVTILNYHLLFCCNVTEIEDILMSMFNF